jgi:hypothetical protein
VFEVAWTSQGDRAGDAGRHCHQAARRRAGVSAAVGGGRGARALREAAAPAPAPDLNEDVFWVVHVGNRETPSSQYRI